MALVDCSECGSEVSSSAPACPRCGKPQDVRQSGSGIAKVGTVILALAVAGLWILGRSVEPDTDSDVIAERKSATPGTAPRKRLNPAVVIGPKALYSEYSRNEVAADLKYKGRQLFITGRVTKIGKDIADSIYVTLDSGHMLRSVQVFFGDDLTAQVAQLSKGQTVTVRGRCKGLVLTNVLVGEARFSMSIEARLERANQRIQVKKDYRGAIEDATAVIELVPNSADAFIIRANARALDGAYGEAIADYDKFLELSPKSTVAILNRGVAKMNSGNRVDAISDFTKYIRAHPKDDLGYGQRALAREQSKDLKGALGDLNRAVELVSNRKSREGLYDLLYSRGDLHRQLGHLDLAAQDWRRSLELNPGQKLAPEMRKFLKAQ